MEPFDDAVRLRALGLGSGMVDVLQIQLVFVTLVIAAIFGASIRQHAAERNVVASEERDHPVIQQISGGDRRLAVVELGKSDLGICLDEGLLVDPAHALHGAHVESVLGTAIAGTFTLKFTVGLLVGLGFLQSGELALGEDQAILGDLGFQRLQSEFHALQFVAQPDRTHTGR